MSILIKHNNTIGSTVNFCLKKKQSELICRAKSFDLCSVETRSTKYSLEPDCTIVSDSTNQSFESSSGLIVDSEDEATDIVRKRKRQRVLSTSEESSPEPRSRSVSPEITHGGSAVAYKLHEIKGEFLIIKVPMSTPQARPKKCSDRDIANMLDSDSDTESIFESLKKSGAQVVGSLPKESKNPESLSTPKKGPRRLSRIINSENRERFLEKTPSKYRLPEEDEREVSLRIKLRRSTEQSNFKIETNLNDTDRKCRTSRRTTMGTPKKCGFGDCDGDHSAHKKTRGTPKTPKGRSQASRNNEAGTPTARRTRKNSSNDNCKSTLENDRPENGAGEFNSDENDDTDNAVTRRRTARNKGDLETPKKRTRTLDEAATPRSARTRRNTKLVNYNNDGLGDVLNKENKSDNDMDEDSDGSPGRGDGRRSAKPIVGTPRKQIKILEEASTPKRTPRRSVVKIFEESTPKRTPRKSTMAKVEEPITPTTTVKRISRVNTPSMRNGCLTPSMRRRTANIGKPITLLEEARAQLHVSAVPKSLPCREEEFNDIYQFLERKLLDNNGGCIYISGVPGTGKTATVNEVIRCLKKLVAKGDLENFNFIEINGMKLSEPRQAYVQILKQMKGQAATWEQAYQILEKRFTQSTAKRPMTLLLVDELDLLCNKRQDVVYNLLDWPAKANAQLVVITIANTMDLPERVLMGRVTSRLGLTRLTFQPYNHKQLQEIVTARLRDSDAFKSEAIQLVARKVAAVSGDARRALDICRRATEIAELNDGKIVTMQDVNQALTEMIASAKVQAIKHCSEMERMFLQAVSAEISRTGVEETSFHSVYRQFESLCSFEGLKIPNVTQTLGICGRLGANRLLLCEHSRTDTQQRILLNVSSDDIHFAMQTIA